MASCPNGDLFIADTGNNRIRRLDASSGLISTVVGDGVEASSGDGRHSTIFPIAQPLGVACNAFGNVFATSLKTVRFLAAEYRGVVDGSGLVRSIYGSVPRVTFPENITRCLSGIVVVDATHLQFADNCTGMLIEIENAAK